MKKINLLNEFFNSRSDASTLEASEQEHLESAFEVWYEEKSKDFEFVSRMLMKHLAENYHPHTRAVIESNLAQLWEGQMSITNDDYIID